MLWYQKEDGDVAQDASYEENTGMKMFCNLEGKGRRRHKTGHLNWENSMRSESSSLWEHFAKGQGWHLSLGTIPVLLIESGCLFAGEFICALVTKLGAGVLG